MSLWICVICGKKYANPTRMLKGRVSTWHFDRCDYCGEETNVTGGRIYTTSEYGAEHVIWDTNIVDVDTLQQCLVHEQTLRSIK